MYKTASWWKLKVNTVRLEWLSYAIGNQLRVLENAQARHKFFEKELKENLRAKTEILNSDDANIPIFW